ncbi:MAG TPA: cob(I)yrinic acid a,c-diamide adenosyltransferase [Gallionellaceae bacterium]|nr:cob(I)yrinic acid a,c-diamide adenosyltransferase [Gallionellaceae bacterium]
MADTPEQHSARMARKKAVVDAGIAQATIERGVVIVNTGNGKGKSTAGFGMVARALGHGMRVGIVQFIKGSFSTGEEAFFRRFAEVSYHVMGEGFTWETQDKERDIACASAAWKIACELLQDKSIAVVLLDELNIALKYKYIQIEEVLAALRNRPAHQHVVITGRGAPDELIEFADTVTEMNLLKHAYHAGVKAQNGVEL